MSPGAVSPRPASLQRDATQVSRRWRDEKGTQKRMLRGPSARLSSAIARPVAPPPGAEHAAFHRGLWTAPRGLGNEPVGDGSPLPVDQLPPRHSIMGRRGPHCDHWATIRGRRGVPHSRGQLMPFQEVSGKNPFGIVRDERAPPFPSSPCTHAPTPPPPPRCCWSWPPTVFAGLPSIPTQTPSADGEPPQLVERRLGARLQDSGKKKMMHVTAGPRRVPRDRISQEGAALHPRHARETTSTMLQAFNAQAATPIGGAPLDLPRPPARIQRAARCEPSRPGQTPAPGEAAGMRCAVQSRRLTCTSSG